MRLRFQHATVALLPLIGFQQATSLLGAQTKKSVFQPARTDILRNTDIPVCAPNGHSYPFPSAVGCERSLLLAPKSGAAWHHAAGRDRPIENDRQHCAADVDHYVAQRGRPRWNERLMKFIGGGIGRTEQ